MTRTRIFLGHQARRAVALFSIALATPGMAGGQAKAHPSVPVPASTQATQRVLIQAEIVEATPAQARVISSPTPNDIQGAGRYQAMLANAGAECLQFPAWATAADTTWRMQASHDEGEALSPGLGTNLQVTPHVNPDHTLRLLVHFVKTDSATSGSAGLATDELQTTRTVASGETVLLGGIVEEGQVGSKELLIFVTTTLQPSMAQTDAPRK